MESIHYGSAVKAELTECAAKLYIIRSSGQGTCRHNYVAPCDSRVDD